MKFLKNISSFDLAGALFMRAVLSVAVVHILTSCSPRIKVSSDYDRAASFSEYKTFAIEKVTMLGGVSQLNEDRIVSAVRLEMTKKGLVEVATSPDLKINVVTVVKNKQDLSVNGNTYASRAPIRPYGYWARTRTGHATVQTVKYREGTLVIDVIDTKKYKQVWTAAGNGEMTKKPKNPDETVTMVVSKILADFPIANK